ncbi:anhydro-N-acetylmuramic acid kinase [Cytophagaceae bacterium YF14B1]|uniref:Anhydro-N-acetylmuramic acid kinase n=1 Tax=Xanthocytophaga flava TaxID=3048013 RepID=A0AAE3QMC6_9BACT|nr:anhydro-N-acetylmuramic acid kinase [Xanthocytophaga flavus]MDJ1481590.1 anhydro-N-acetylmuramic acid kinase [Xanthocytophaga flavus]
MNTQIARLYQIAQKPQRLIIGLMSGTSLDGLDVALCQFTGSGIDAKTELLAFDTISYTDDIKQTIRTVFSKKQVDLETLTLLNPWIGKLHASIILKCLQKWKYTPAEIDLIASHGQTIYHAPQSLHKQPDFPNATLQIGDGDHIAVQTGIITLSDFRQKHIAAGGEGAPLAVYGDYILFSQKDEDRIMLNIGGIANFTFLSGDLDATKMFSTDVGPGNTLIDAFSRLHYNRPFDEKGTIAASGSVHQLLLTTLLNHPFFQAGFPKTTGPELFSLAYVHQAQQQSQTENISPQDLIATLTRFSAEGIAQAVKRNNLSDKAVVYMSGGGMHNPVLVKHLHQLLPDNVLKTTADLQILPDAKEAVLFAILANETVAGGLVNFGNRPGIPNVTMGKISLPA